MGAKAKTWGLGLANKLNTSQITERLSFVVEGDDAPTQDEVDTDTQIQIQTMNRLTNEIKDANKK